MNVRTALRALLALLPVDTNPPTNGRFRNAAAAGWTVAGTITPTDNGGIIPEDFNSNPKILDRNLGFNSDFKFKDASGYQSRTSNESNNLSKKDIQDAMTSAVKELKIYTTIEDIRKEDQNYTIIESRGTV